MYLVFLKNTYVVTAKEVCNALEKNKIPYHLHMFTEDVILPNEHFIGNTIIGMPLDSDLILAVGSGTINDICRYVSTVTNKTYCILGTAPSMDGYVSSVSPLIYNNLKLTLEGQTPHAVFLDPEILTKAPQNMISAGVGDLLGKINCLTDWKLSKIVNDEWHCDFISEIVDVAVNNVTNNYIGIANGDKNAITNLVEGLLISGVCMDFAQNSRPASGCEHHISHFWEIRYLLEGREAVFHGTKVGIGTIIALKAYEYVANLSPDFFAIKNIDRMSFDVWEQKIHESFLGASDEIIALEKKSQKNSTEKLNTRLLSIEKNWNKIKELANNAPKACVVYDILNTLDAPTKPQDIGVNKELAIQTVLYAKEIRDRYTVLQLLWDLGELENFADMIVKEYYS